MGFKLTRREDAPIIDPEEIRRLRRLEKEAQVLMNALAYFADPEEWFREYDGENMGWRDSIYTFGDSDPPWVMAQKAIDSLKEAPDAE